MRAKKHTTGETVIFLGAGASKAVGLPLTNELLPRVLERLRDRSLFRDDADDRDRLERCLRAILPGLVIRDAQNQELWQKTLPAVTDILSGIDYLLQSSNAPMPQFGLDELACGRRLLERAIFELLVRNEPNALRMEGVPGAVREEWEGTSARGLLPPRLLEYEREVGRTVDWIMELASRGRVTVISTNYDIEVEQELYNRLGYDSVFRQVDFGTSVRHPVQGTVYQRPEHAQFGMYKLHGSLNWLRCNVCDTIYLNPVGAIAYLSFLLGDDAARRKANDEWLQRLEASDANKCHCGYQPLKHVIVAPSFVRDVRDPILLEIWRNALEGLRRAAEWIIVGYSLPPEDVAIRSMLLRGYAGRDDQQPPRVVVVQKEEKEPEMTRYRLLFPGHGYVPGGLSSYLDP